MPEGFNPDKLAGQRLIAETRLTRNELRVERAIKKALAVHKAHALAAIRQQHLTAAAPPDAFGFNTWETSVDDVVLPAVGRVLEDLAGSLSSFLKLSPEIRAQMLGKIDLASRTAGFTDKVRSIGPDISTRLMDELAVGVGKGEGIDKLTRRIDGVFEIGNNIAERIARTETHGAAEATTYASAGAIAESGYGLTKSWIDTADARTRETHVQAAIDNRDIPFDQPFQVGDAELDHPGDPSGPPEEVISCRCSVSYRMLDGSITDVEAD